MCYAEIVEHAGFIKLTTPKNMSDKTFHFTTAVLFSVIGILHIVRFYYQWEAVIAGWEVPMWVSVVAVVIALILAAHGFKKVS